MTTASTLSQHAWAALGDGLTVVAMLAILAGVALPLLAGWSAARRDRAWRDALAHAIDTGDTATVDRLTGEPTR